MGAWELFLDPQTNSPDQPQPIDQSCSLSAWSLDEGRTTSSSSCMILESFSQMLDGTTFFTEEPPFSSLSSFSGDISQAISLKNRRAEQLNAVYCDCEVRGHIKDCTKVRDVCRKKRQFFKKAYCPQSFSGGGLYLNGIWLLWTMELVTIKTCMVGYYGACIMGYYGTSMQVTMIVHERLLWSV